MKSCWWSFRASSWQADDCMEYYRCHIEIDRYRRRPPHDTFPLWINQIVHFTQAPWWNLSTGSSKCTGQLLCGLQRSCWNLLKKHILAHIRLQWHCSAAPLRQRPLNHEMTRNLVVTLVLQPAPWLILQCVAVCMCIICGIGSRNVVFGWPRLKCVSTSCEGFSHEYVFIKEIWCIRNIHNVNG